MVLQYWLIIVTKGFSMAHGDKERIIDTGVLDVAEQTSQESTHDIQVAKVAH